MSWLFLFDLRSLALLRLGVGALLLYDLFWRATELTELVTDQGVLPRALVTESYWNPAWWSIHLYSGSFSGQALLFAFHALAALALLLGWHTRLAGGLCYLLTLSLHNRNPLVLDGGDRLLLLLLFWGLFLPWGSRFSWDNRRQAPKADVAVLVGGAAYLFQICTVYFVSVYWKLHPVWLTERTAIYRTFELEQFTKPLGTFLMGFPGLLAWSSLLVVLVELIAPLLLLAGNTRLRWFGVALLAVLHTAIAAAMDLQFFPLVSLVALLGLLPSAAWSDQPPSTVALPSSDRWATSPLLAALVAFFLSLMLAWNALMIVNERRLPTQVNTFTKLVSAFRLSQFWDLFAPVPREIDCRYFVEARLADGRVVDLLRGGQSLSSASVKSPYQEFKNQRQRVYLSSLEWAAEKRILLRYLRRQAVIWNEAYPENPVLWTRLWSLRKKSRYLDPGRRPELVDLGWAVAPNGPWLGPVPPGYLGGGEGGH